jgi:hypothetical protein
MALQNTVCERTTIQLTFLEGEWERVEGVIKRSGKGIYTENAERYEGKIIITSCWKLTREGDWKDDKMSGSGKYAFASGAVYEVHTNSFSILLNRANGTKGNFMEKENTHFLTELTMRERG